MDEDILLGGRAVEAGFISAEQLATSLRDAWLDPEQPDSLWEVMLAREWIDHDQLAALRRGGRSSGYAAKATEFLPERNERYRYQKHLGTGGMGTVKQLHDEALGRSVAMKQLRVEQGTDDEAVGTLLDEARVAGSLEHPNIIPIYDVGFHNNQEPYYTMRLMDQMSMEDVLLMLRRGNPEAAREFPLIRLLRIFQQVCMAIDYAHSRNVIHRDIKPDNIRLGRYGEVQVADWGLARVAGMPDRPLQKALQEAHQRGEHDPCIVIGSPNYMSPEQACGLNDEIRSTTDIYSLGCVLYEILTFHVPFEEQDTMVLLDKVELEDVIPPSERCPDRVIPPVLERVCMAALEKDPNERIQDVRILWRAIEDYIEGFRDRERADTATFEHVQRGHRYGDGYHRLREARERLQRRVATSRAGSRRRRLQQDLDALELEIITTWGEAYDAYTRALGFNPEDLVARAKLAELSWLRLQDAEAASDPVSCQFFWNMLRRFNDGSYDLYLVGEATVTVETDPPGATIGLKSYVEPSIDREQPMRRAVGRTPVSVADLPAGLYLLSAELDDHDSLSMPIFLRAGQDPELLIRLTPTRRE